MKRRYAYDVNSDNSSWSLIDYNSDFLTGKVCCLKFNDKVKPLVVNNGLEEITIRAPKYQMIEFYPNNGNYVLTIMFDDNAKLIEWYFDISKEVGIENGIPYEDDLYLDYIITKDEKELIVDEDELKEAFDNHDITEDDLKSAYLILSELKTKFYGNLEDLKKFTQDIYDIFNEKNNRLVK